jgi:quinohemoprotein ethanol dehydrogenase
MGGRFTHADADDRGILAALDVTTNKLAWRQQWREICYSGSVVTAGGLLFVGRNDGRLTALDKANGKLLWEFMTDAGVNTTVTTFEWNGDQRVVVHAGGGGGGVGPRPGAPAAARPVDVEHGRQLYAEACVACHGEGGDGGHGGGPTLVGGLPLEAILAVSQAGRNTMPAFGRAYSEADLKDVASYIVEVLAR